MEPVEIDEDVKAFLIESYENLDEIEKDALTLEKTSSPDASLVRIYRALHTLKGNCGFLPFPKLESVAHASEDLLSSLRDRHRYSHSGTLGALKQQNQLLIFLKRWRLGRSQGKILLQLSRDPSRFG